MIDLDELEAKARAATPGPWRWDTDPSAGDCGGQGPDLTTATGKRTDCPYPGCWWIEDGQEHKAMGTAHSHRDEAIVVSSYGHDSWGINVSAEDAAFIEAANPETILELVAMVRAGSAP